MISKSEGRDRSLIVAGKARFRAYRFHRVIAISLKWEPIATSSVLGNEQNICSATMNECRDIEHLTSDEYAAFRRACILQTRTTFTPPPRLSPLLREVVLLQ